MPCSSLIQMGQFYGQRELIVRSGQFGPAEAAQLYRTLDTLIEQGIRRLWLDCQQLESLTYYGQQAILQVVRRAATAGLDLFWYGFSPRVKQELAASGLYLLLPNVPLSSYQNLPGPLAQEPNALVGVAPQRKQGIRSTRGPLPGS